MDRGDQDYINKADHRRDALSLMSGPPRNLVVGRNELKQRPGAVNAHRGP